MLVSVPIRMCTAIAVLSFVLVARELFIPETQEVVRPHEQFMLFATQNPPGLYGGRKSLSLAFRNRFLELHVDDIPGGLFCVCVFVHAHASLTRQLVARSLGLCTWHRLAQACLRSLPVHSSRVCKRTAVSAAFIPAFPFDLQPPSWKRSCSSAASSPPSSASAW